MTQETMKVRNENLAGCELTLRYTRDDDDNRIVAKGDANGVFNVPVKDGKFLLTTKGWKAYKVPAVVPDDPIEDGSDGLPDLDKLTKAELLELAESYVTEGYDLEVDDTLLKADIKKAIANAVFE